MFNHRFLLIISSVSLSLVAMAVWLSFSDTPSSADYTSRWEAMGEYYANQATAESYQSFIEARPYIMDSATRSYIAWGQAMQVRNAIDSGTRSYIAWGEALEAAGKLGNSGACSNTTQENIFARIPNNLDSATRSYIAWGLALQAKNDIHACH